VQTDLRYERWFLPISVPLGLGPRHSDVRVENGTFHVRMGWGFKADVPLSAIADAKLNNDWVFAWGAHGWRGRWLVNGSSKGIGIDHRPTCPGLCHRHADQVAHALRQRDGSRRADRRDRPQIV
jgi:hypothetical protein